MNEPKEQTKLDQLMPYLEEINKIETQQKLESVKKKYTDKLSTLINMGARALERFDSYNIRIEDHWRMHGKNYDINPELSLVPVLQDSFKDYITFSSEKEQILVDFIKELLTTANEIKAGITSKKVKLSE